MARYTNSKDMGKQTPFESINNVKNAIAKYSRDRNIAMHEGNYEEAVELGDKIHRSYQLLVTLVAKYGDQ